MKKFISIFIVLMISMLMSQVQAQGCDADDPNDSIAPAKIKIFGLYNLNIITPYLIRQKVPLNSEGQELVLGDVYLRISPITLCWRPVLL